MAVQASAEFEVLYPGSSRSATECAMNLVRAGDLVVGRVAAILRPFGLTPAGGLVLSILADADRPLPPYEIGERLIVTRATVTGLVDSLERRGYVRRTAHPNDGRMLLVGLTPKGRKVASNFRPVVHGHQKVWFEGLSEVERATLLRLLGRIQNRIASLPPEGFP
jgi:DNA-binding MarR family transcriptional regulator